MNLEFENGWGGPRGDAHQVSAHRSRWRRRESSRHELAAEREKQKIQQAVEIHRAWLKAQASSSIPNVGYLEALRQADEAASAEAELKRELRQELAPNRSITSLPTAGLPHRAV
jgi:hypothetical protein